MEGFIGEIRLFGGNFAPRSWAFCDGSQIDIASNSALFSILGTTYGGDGRTYFLLPDLRGRTAIGPGTGPGLPSYQQGVKVGSPTTVLTANNLPSHTHAATTNVQAYASATEGDDPTPSSTKLWSKSGQGDPDYGPLDGTAVPLDENAVTASTTLANTGNGTSFNNMQPSLACYYIICLQGIFPSRN